MILYEILRTSSCVWPNSSIKSHWIFFAEPCLTLFRHYVRWIGILGRNDQCWLTCSRINCTTELRLSNDVCLHDDLFVVICSARISTIEKIGSARIWLLSRLKLQFHGVSRWTSLFERSIIHWSAIAAKVASIGSMLWLIGTNHGGTGARPEPAVASTFTVTGHVDRHFVHPLAVLTPLLWRQNFGLHGTEFVQNLRIVSIDSASLLLAIPFIEGARPVLCRPDRPSTFIEAFLSRTLSLVQKKKRKRSSHRIKSSTWRAKASNWFMVCKLWSRLTVNIL